MAKHYAKSSTVSSFEDDVKYPMVLQEMHLEEGKYGPQMKFVLAREEAPDVTQWVYTSMKLGEHQGRVAKLRAIANALLGRPERAVIDYFDDDIMGVKYDDEAAPIRLKVGMKLVARGETLPGNDGVERFKFSRFWSYRPVTETKHQDDDIHPDDVPF